MGGGPSTNNLNYYRQSLVDKTAQTCFGTSTGAQNIQIDAVRFIPSPNCKTSSIHIDNGHSVSASCFINNMISQSTNIMNSIESQVATKMLGGKSSTNNENVTSLDMQNYVNQSCQSNQSQSQNVGLRGVVYEGCNVRIVDYGSVQENCTLGSMQSLAISLTNFTKSKAKSGGDLLEIIAMGVCLIIIVVIIVILLKFVGTGKKKHSSGKDDSNSDDSDSSNNSGNSSNSDNSDNDGSSNNSSSGNSGSGSNKKKDKSKKKKNGSKSNKSKKGKTSSASSAPAASSGSGSHSTLKTAGMAALLVGGNPNRATSVNLLPIQQEQEKKQSKFWSTAIYSFVLVAIIAFLFLLVLFGVRNARTGSKTEDLYLSLQ